MSESDIIKQNLNEAIDKAVKKFFSETDSKVFTQSKKLDIASLIRLILTMDGGSLAREIERHKLPFSASALCQSRQKLPPSVLEDVFHFFYENCKHIEHRYRGYRFFAIDGTNIPVFKNPQSETFLWNGSMKTSYSAYHLTPIYDIIGNVYVDAVIQPKSRFDEISAAEYLLSWYDFPEKSILTLDRGFESYNMIGILSSTPNLGYVLRVKQTATAMKVIKQLPMEELDVDCSVVITQHQRKNVPENYVFIQTGSLKGKENSPKTKISKWYFGDLYELKFRVVRRKLPNQDNYETLITSLGRDEFSAEEIMDIYKRRWSIEVNAFRNLKYTLGLMAQHSKIDALSLQQIWATLIMQNFSSYIVSSIAIQQKDTNKYEYAVNYKMAVSFCKEFFRAQNVSGDKLIEDISKYTIPIRPDRQEERNLSAKPFSGFCYRIPS